MREDLPPFGAEASPTSWQQVRRGIRGLRPKTESIQCVERPWEGVLSVVLAGNTPLLAWPVLHHAVELGVSVIVKQSRDELVWTRLFVETLAEIDPEVAARIHLMLFPGDDPRTKTLVQGARAVIAYGSDTTIQALRSITPATTPFLGFGHALSVALWPTDSATLPYWLATDVLLYDQAGCLSPHVVFVEPQQNIVSALDAGFRHAVRDLVVEPRTDPAQCYAIREARDLALMDGCLVSGDDGLRYTLIVHPRSCSHPKPVGLGVLHLIPIERIEDFIGFLGEYSGSVSCVGVAGHITKEVRMAAWNAGASRVCRIGQMQTPPLNWRNGGVDLRKWLLNQSLA